CPAHSGSPGTRASTSDSRAPRRRPIAAAESRPCLHSRSLPPGHHVMPLLTPPPAFSRSSPSRAPPGPTLGSGPTVGSVRRSEPHGGRSRPPDRVTQLTYRSYSHINGLTSLRSC